MPEAEQWSKDETTVEEGAVPGHSGPEQRSSKALEERGEGVEVFRHAKFAQRSLKGCNREKCLNPACKFISHFAGLFMGYCCGRCKLWHDNGYKKVQHGPRCEAFDRAEAERRDERGRTVERLPRPRGTAAVPSAAERPLTVFTAGRQRTEEHTVTRPLTAFTTSQPRGSSSRQLPGGDITEQDTVRPLTAFAANLHENLEQWKSMSDEAVQPAERKAKLSSRRRKADRAKREAASARGHQQEEEEEDGTYDSDRDEDVLAMEPATEQFEALTARPSKNRRSSKAPKRAGQVFCGHMQDSVADEGSSGGCPGSGNDRWRGAQSKEELAQETHGSLQAHCSGGSGGAGCRIAGP
eukprot:TRINITY_DN27426_c0_g2_i1.p1 TRINITY_DN27426_c0_g2~~TRINITY_DN27426_c0_g2_i1.p1  ORF type:complete len:353 (-),score=73.25 TRINITY_DN27426_c0_g2_i1:506-1564(-)